MVVHYRFGLPIGHILIYIYEIIHSITSPIDKYYIGQCNLKRNRLLQVSLNSKLGLAHKIKRKR